MPFSFQIESVICQLNGSRLLFTLLFGR